MKALLLVHASATLFMFGVITLVQVVHYPLFDHVGKAGFAAYEAAHTRLITYVVFPPMAVELLAALALVVWRPAAVAPWMAWVGLALVGVIWLSTAFLQVPQHQTLAQGFDARAHALLVQTNWIRTVAWALRSGLVVWMLARLLPPTATLSP